MTSNELPHITFKRYEVYPVQDHGDHAEICKRGKETFFSLYGVLESNELVCVGDFTSLDSALIVGWLIDPINGAPLVEGDG